MGQIANSLSESHLARISESRDLVEKLSLTRVFRKYERAFSAASRLPLSLRPVQSFRMPARGHRRENDFCGLMAEDRKACVACLRMQCELEAKATKGSQTAPCFAGLMDTMIPIRLGSKVVAFLQTGQVSFERPSIATFDAFADELEKQGSRFDRARCLAAYMKSPFMESSRYHGFVQMLELFAETLSATANAILLEGKSEASPIVKRAKSYIARHYTERITLDDIARATNSSPRHFCKVFKEGSGLTFVNYLNRYRIEQAQKLLRESRQRVSEIAFSVGFDSLAQYNRMFKQISGKSPTCYRKQSANW